MLQRKIIATRWQNDLLKTGSSVELSTAHRDGIDVLVQLADAISGILLRLRIVFSLSY